jgi:transcriptional regulator with XRE-family HTH domain
MSIITSLRRVRARQALSLRALGERVGIAASNLSTIESGRRGSSTATAERIAQALGVTLVPVELGGRITVAEASEYFVDADDRRSYRLLLQVANDLQSALPYVRTLLVAEKPRALTARWDAALAGLVEYFMDDSGLPSPDWAGDRLGDISWNWSPSGGPLVPDEELVPEPFRRRGVLVEAGELESI